MRYSPVLFFCLILLACFVTACTNPSMQKESLLTQASPPPKPIFLTGLTPAEVDAEVIQPGLNVTYYLKFFKRDVTYLQHMRKGEYRKKEGKPIMELDHQFGERNVFDSGKSRGVAMQMRGYINFPQSGAYSMQALSNDGILLNISDQLSNIAEITIDRPGWYPLAIDYFQRKGTAALKLYWKTPGDADFAIVPASAYGHLK
jgi:hypothetical protein